MNKFLLILLLCLIAIKSFAGSDSTEVKARKLTYSDFLGKYSINDTSAAVIEIFFDKKDNNAKGEMSFLPITAGVFLIFPVIGAGLSVVSIPMFLHGSYTLIKYRKKKLVNVLTEYRNTGELPKGLRKKVTKSITYEQYNYE
ncbi:hypothetical protein FRY74_06715 [Vicingus serpentipes]|uniref:Uncharacterized protein n=1 Tax=Vicingus serpentipes TaxID=1926625 RepID=A0A5C6RS77_9FLAO|nr:hypothetical protein [Vicingus serpentipes]TXB65113.1 hypothetical protein FRY74_06715 [Vicingus serpentipes]